MPEDGRLIDLQLTSNVSDLDRFFSHRTYKTIFNIRDDRRPKDVDCDAAPLPAITLWAGVLTGRERGGAPLPRVAPHAQEGSRDPSGGQASGAPWTPERAP
jgi:hypothetical protein